MFYKRYVDKIFGLFKGPERVKPFADYMNSKHINIFSFKTEKNDQMSFLDVKVFRENGKFMTNVYRKETFSGVYINFYTFIPLEQKFVAFALFLICLSFTLKFKNKRKNLKEL